MPYFRHLAQGEMSGHCHHLTSVAIYRSERDTVMFCPACGLASIHPALERGDKFYLLNTPEITLPCLERVP